MRGGEEEATAEAIPGLVLPAAAAVVAVSVSISKGTAKTDVWGRMISNLSVGTVFAIDILSTAAGLIGMLAVLAGMAATPPPAPTSSAVWSTAAALPTAMRDRGSIRARGGQHQPMA